MAVVLVQFKICQYPSPGLSDEGRRGQGVTPWNGCLHGRGRGESGADVQRQVSIAQRVAGEALEGSKAGTQGRATNGLLTADLLVLSLSSESNVNVRDRAWSW